MQEKKKCIPYLLWAFGIGWTIQLAASWFFTQGNTTVYQLLILLTMFAPMVAVLLSRSGFRDMGWMPRVKRDIKYILLAWLLPAALSIAGAALYFLLFPAAFDPTLRYLTTQMGPEALAQMEEKGLTPALMAVITLVQAFTYAPFFNMIPALGEEVGWRGVLYPALKQRLGTAGGRVLGGIIWGAWHWPLMLLTGYEYGTEYWGAPITGMVMFCLFTTAAGILLDWLYEKTNCIWLPSLGHGAVNCFGTLGILFLHPDYTHHLLLGPVPIGLIAGLPMLLTALILCLKKGKTPAVS